MLCTVRKIHLNDRVQQLFTDGDYIPINVDIFMKFVGYLSMNNH